jgi:two-component system, NtrC family, nitrogen regulation response regulator GlnG
MVAHVEAGDARSLPFQILVWPSTESLQHTLQIELELPNTIVRALPTTAEAEYGNFAANVICAVVALERDATSFEAGLRVVRKLQGRGVPTFALGADLADWPLAARCQVLLSGTQTIFESKSQAGLSPLRAAISRKIHERIRESEEQKNLREIMKQHGIVGESPSMLEVFRRVLRISRLSDLPVMLHGESGTGKELLARAIYRLDPKRSRGAFVALNCSAMSKELAESELFGHRRGAFTGAEHTRKGLIRSADGGVLLLDEIGDLNLELQAKLLRVLQENRVLSVGEDEEVPVSVRVIVASHRDIPKMVRSGEFRGDLFHRLNVLCIEIPPLRERPEDLWPLVSYFYEKYRDLCADLPLNAGRDFAEALARIPLPGNARQVENFVRRAIAQKDDDTPLGLADLPREVLESLVEPQAGRSGEDGFSGQGESEQLKSSDAGATLQSLLATSAGNLNQALEKCERVLLQMTLEKARGNQSQAAQLLGITPRSVYSKLRKHGLHPGH